MKELLLVFDKDGVIIDSEATKLALIEKVFSDYPSYTNAIHTYNYETIGIPRAFKFQHICKNILGLKNVAEAIKKYADEYTNRVNVELRQVSLIPGIRSYLQLRAERKFVCSAAPYDEVVQNMEDHKLTQYFEGLHAFPEKKAEVMLTLKKKHDAKIVFWGDTLADYAAAQAADVFFIGLSNAGENPFSKLSIPCISDFSKPDKIQGIIDNYLRKA